MLTPGTEAPDFELFNHHRQPVRLSSFRGRRHVVLAFHPLAFTPNCTGQMQDYQREWPRFEASDVHVLGVSSDAGPSKKAWADSLGGLPFDLLSDFHPQGQVASAYGVLGESGLPERSVFLVDKSGTIRWARRYHMDQHPPIADVLEAVAALEA